MGTRRGNNEGTIYKRSDGRWCAQLTLSDGKRKTIYRKKKQEIIDALHDARQALKQSLAVPDERQTVQQYLASWLEMVQPPAIKARTHLRYQQFVANIEKVLGRQRLAKLTPQQVQGLYSHYLKNGMSPTTVNHMHALLHLALEKALRLGMVAYNVCDRVDPPPINREERPTWTAEQARQFLDTIVGDPLEALYVLEIYTGMREGELLALQWPEVDLKAGTLKVTATLSYIHGEFLFTPPKTRRSRRTIWLAAPVIEALQEHRKRQLEQRMRLRDIWDDSYDLVFPNGIGRPIEATNFLKRSCYPLVEKASLPRIHFHDLRQSVAHIMKKMGVQTEGVSETFGHEHSYITDRFYGHDAPELQQKAMEAMERALRKIGDEDQSQSNSQSN
ncbi:MAG TPA: site-specific integrase [Ktedonobacterales bacterium]|jgi:integrase